MSIQWDYVSVWYRYTKNNLSNMSQKVTINKGNQRYSWDLRLSGYQNSVKTGSDKPNLFQNSDSTILVKVLQYYSLCFDYFKTKYCCYYLLFDDMILVVIISLLSLLQPTSNQPLDVGSKSGNIHCWLIVNHLL